MKHDEKKIEEGSIYLEIRKLFFIRPANLDDANDIANKGMRLVEQYAEHMLQQLVEAIKNDKETTICYEGCNCRNRIIKLIKQKYE